MPPNCAFNQFLLENYLNNNLQMSVVHTKFREILIHFRKSHRKVKDLNSKLLAVKEFSLNT